MHVDRHISSGQVAASDRQRRVAAVTIAARAAARSGATVAAQTSSTKLKIGNGHCAGRRAGSVNILNRGLGESARANAPDAARLAGSARSANALRKDGHVAHIERRAVGLREHFGYAAVAITAGTGENIVDIARAAGSADAARIDDRIAAGDGRGGGSESLDDRLSARRDLRHTARAGAAASAQADTGVSASAPSRNVRGRTKRDGAVDAIDYGVPAVSVAAARLPVAAGGLRANVA